MKNKKNSKKDSGRWLVILAIVLSLIAIGLVVGSKMTGNAVFDIKKTFSVYEGQAKNFVFDGEMYSLKVFNVSDNGVGGHMVYFQIGPRNQPPISLNLQAGEGMEFGPLHEMYFSDVVKVGNKVKLTFRITELPPVTYKGVFDRLRKCTLEEPVDENHWCEPSCNKLGKVSIGSELYISYLKTFSDNRTDFDLFTSTHIGENQLGLSNSTNWEEEALELEQGSGNNVVSVKLLEVQSKCICCSA